MTKFKKWFERSFDFDLQTWMYPNMVERLRGTPARVEDRVGGLSTAILTKRVKNSWSIQEHIGHLVDLEPLWLDRLKDFESSRATLKPADLENRKTHEADHNRVPIEDIIAALRNARTGIVQRLDAYDDTFIERTAKHPRLQTDMRVLDLVFFIAEHDDHHLAKLTDIIEGEL